MFAPATFLAVNINSFDLTSMLDENHAKVAVESPSTSNTTIIIVVKNNCDDDLKIDFCFFSLFTLSLPILCYTIKRIFNVLFYKISFQHPVGLILGVGVFRLIFKTAHCLVTRLWINLSSSMERYIKICSSQVRFSCCQCGSF